MSETYFFKQSRKDKFTILDNTCIQDTTLSWKSKGVHTYLMSLPNDWKIFITEIVNHSSDGKAALYSAIQELEKHGYVRKIRNRRNDGCFDSTIYYVYEKPNSELPPLSDFPDVDNPDMENPDTDNRTLLNTNKLNTNIQKTKLTNYKQPDSESVFVNIIKELFSCDYPFDKNFESDVMKRLESSQIETENLETFLKYVFERTEILNPSKSFEGLYRKLALSSSIATDFKLSFQNKKSETHESNKIAFKKTICSICGKEFNEIDYYCPTCGASLKAINGEDKIEYQVHKKLFEMSPDEKQNYEQAYSTWEQQTKTKTGRLFLLTNERIQFWKDYGILSAETEEN